MGLDQNIQVALPESSTLTITTTESSILRLTAVDKGYMSMNSECMCFCNLAMQLIVLSECTYVFKLLGGDTMSANQFYGICIDILPPFVNSM